MSPSNFFHHQKRNIYITWFYIIGFIVLFCSFGYAVDVWVMRKTQFPWATLTAALFSLITSYFSYVNGDQWILKIVDAKPISYQDPAYPLLINLCQEMSIASGIPRPKIYVIEDSAVNAFATGHSPKDAKIAITRGLVDVLDRNELQAVIAHEMAHIKNNDILLKMVVSVFVGALVFLSDWAKHTIRMGRYSHDIVNPDNNMRTSVSFGSIYIIAVGVYAFILGIFAWLIPILMKFMSMMLSHKREYLADATAVQMTRNPLALISALIKVADSPYLHSDIPRNISQLFIYEAMRSDHKQSHPPLYERVQRLEGMAYILGKK
jgi:heat shock protein HtpX